MQLTIEDRSFRYTYLKQIRKDIARKLFYSGTEIYLLPKDINPNSYHNLTKSIKYSYDVDFDELPATAKQYVLALTKVKFQSNVLGDQVLHNALLQDLQRVRTAFVAEDIRQADRNMLDTFPNSRVGYRSISGVLGRR